MDSSKTEKNQLHEPAGAFDTPNRRQKEPSFEKVFRGEGIADLLRKCGGWEVPHNKCRTKKEKDHCNKRTQSIYHKQCNQHINMEKKGSNLTE